MSHSINLISHDLTYLLNEQAQTELNKDVAFHLRSQILAGWRVYGVKQDCGRCHFGSRIITIPVWAWHKDQGYKNWYVSHELAHSFAGWKAKHGFEFMRELSRICPASDLRHELGYKPANMIKAGVFPEFTDKELF